uniref:folate gamma-glutamyl hydrolase n=1 Tax=Pundamilia nyererei TaxID=303518 RepID=A0A3B4FP26_9CICH
FQLVCKCFVFVFFFNDYPLRYSMTVTYSEYFGLLNILSCVLAQENLPWDQFARGSSYIAASYVKYLEAAGARVVDTIPLKHLLAYLSKLWLLRLLLPGGDVDLQTSQFSRAAKIFYNLALKGNDAGDYFPIWGTCQGFQQLTVLTANKNLLTLTDTKAVALPLTLTSVAPSSRLFRNFPKDLLRSLASENITANFHSWSLSIRNAKLRRFYKILSTNSDGKKEFISTMEANHYPFYAVQWHPEKSPFEWVDKPGMIHSVSAVRASFYTASFFVSEGNTKSVQSKSSLWVNKKPVAGNLPQKF